jgi:hypothetical protein
MSLHDAAQHLAAHGRGDDKTLVHMTKGEVKSLNDLAMAHGGHLTINPQTGLPEAGFLSAILPMALGAGLMLVPGMQAYAAAGIVGGLKTMQSGSLKQGLMAGLGAYGGASMAGSFGAAGSPAVGVTPTPTITPTPNPVDFSIVQPGPFNPTASISDISNSVTNTGANLGAPTNSIAPTAVAPSAPLGAPGATTAPGFSNLPSAAARGNAISSGASFSNAGDFIASRPFTAAGGAGSVAAGMQKDPLKPAEPDKDMGQRYSYTGQATQPTPAPDVMSYEDMLTKQGNFGRQQNYYPNPKTYTAIGPTEAKDLYHFADGGPVEQMSNQAAMGLNTMYPMSNMATSSFATPYQTPQSTNMLANMVPSGGGAVNTMSGEPSMQGTRMAEGGEAEGAVVESRPSYTYDAKNQRYTAGPSIGGTNNAPQDFGNVETALNNFSEGVARDGITTPMGSYIPPSSNGIPSYTYNPQTREYQQMASGGISDAGYNLGGYSDGGRLLRGPGDGVSDSIPATIGNKQPARLADGEFVVPARIVSELGNGSTEAGARKLYAMMDRVQAARKKTVGKNKVAHNSRADKHLPA